MKMRANFKIGDYKLQFTHKVQVYVEASWSEEGTLLRQEWKYRRATFSIIICMKRATIWDCFLVFPFAIFWSYFFQRK